MPKVELKSPERRAGANKAVGEVLGDYSFVLLSDPGGLTQFGAFIETLHPGSKSSVRHWHEKEDELVYILSGEVTLVEEEETVLMPGDAAAWPAGAPLAHCLENRTDRDASYIVVGTRAAEDRWHYPDHGVTGEKRDGAIHYSRDDGTPKKGEDT